MPDLARSIFPRIDASSTPRTWRTNRLAAGVGDHDVWRKTDEQGAFTQLNLFACRCGTFIETLDLYSAGASEQMIGKWGKARGDSDDLAIATKGRFSPAKGSHRASRRGLTRAVEGEFETSWTRCDRCLFRPWVGSP